MMAESCEDRNCRFCRHKGCCTSCSKTILVTVNFAFLVCGWSMVGFGVWLRVNRDSLFVSHLLNHNHRPETDSGTSGYSNNNPMSLFDSVAFTLIGVGGFLAALSFLGCCGACVESVCFLGFYSILTSFIIAAETFCAFFSTAFINQFSAALLSRMHHQVQFEYNDTARKSSVSNSESYRITAAWDTLQIQLDCCGAVGPQDYLYSSWFNHTPDSTGTFVPLSCCLLLNDDPQRPVPVDADICQSEALILLGQTDQPITQVHPSGCHLVIMKMFADYFNAALTSLIVTVVFQVASFSCSCFLIAKIRRKQSDYSCYDNDYYG